MRTIFIVNSLGTGYPTAKGEMSIKLPDGSFADLSETLGSIAKDTVIDFINALGNGSTRGFTLNPFNFIYTKELSGSATSIAPTYSITYPTGNARTDSMTDQFLGGIVVKKFDKDKNVFNPIAIKNVEVIGANGVVTNADVKVAFKAAMASLIGAGLPIASVAHTVETSSIYTLNDTNYYIELVGDLRWWKLVKVNGVDLSLRGTDVAKFERELAPNMGYIHSDTENKLFEDSNFITDKAATYNCVVLTTKTDSQRPLLPNAAGFPKELYLYFKKDGGTVDALLASFVEWLDNLHTDPVGLIAQDFAPIA